MTRILKGMAVGVTVWVGVGALIAAVCYGAGLYSKHNIPLTIQIALPLGLLHGGLVGLLRRGGVSSAILAIVLSGSIFLFWLVFIIKFYLHPYDPKFMARYVLGVFRVIAVVAGTSGFLTSFVLEKYWPDPEEPEDAQAALPNAEPRTYKLG